MPKVSVRFPKEQVYLRKLGLLPKGKVQTFIDSEVVRLSDSYVPSDTTYTRKSVYENTVFGSGEIIYYAHGKEGGRNIWNDDRDNVHWQDAPMRGPRWSLRMWDAGGKEKVMDGVGRLLHGNRV